MLINFIQELNIFTLYYIVYIPITATFTFLIVPYYFLNISKIFISLLTIFLPYLIKFIDVVDPDTFQDTPNILDRQRYKYINKFYDYLKKIRDYCKNKSKNLKSNNKKVVSHTIILITLCSGLLILLNIIYFILYPNIYKRAIKFNNYYMEIVRIFICILTFIYINFTFATGSIVPLIKELFTRKIINEYNKGAESIKL